MKKAIGLMAVLLLSVTMLGSCGGEKDADTDGADKGKRRGQFRKC